MFEQNSRPSIGGRGLRMDGGSRSLVSADPRAERVGNVWNDVGRLDAKADDVRRDKEDFKKEDI